MNEKLLDAVDELTKPIRSKVIQDGPPGRLVDGRHTETVILPPLLQQLEEAIRGTIGIGGSGSLAHQRNMLDADALYRFTLISSMVKDWARMAGATITPDDIGKTLRAWYVAYSEKSNTPESERFYILKMDGWAKQIREKLNPAKVWEVSGACPICEAETWWSKSTHEEYKFPLVTLYNPEAGPNLIQEAKAMCRACEHVFGVRELAYALENASKVVDNTPVEDVAAS